MRYRTRSTSPPGSPTRPMGCSETSFPTARERPRRSPGGWGQGAPRPPGWLRRGGLHVCIPRLSEFHSLALRPPPHALEPDVAIVAELVGGTSTRRRPHDGVESGRCGRRQDGNLVAQDGARAVARTTLLPHARD